MREVILIAGTHGSDDTWWRHDSPLAKKLEQKGHKIAIPSFQWSTRLDGVIGGNDHWAEGAKDLILFCDRYKIVKPKIVAHSHGGNLAGVAASMGLDIDSLVTVCTPVRADMERVFKVARANIDKWIHIHDRHWDFWQFAGALFDGRRGFFRAMKYADQNVGLDGIGHTGALSYDVIAKYL